MPDITIPPASSITDANNHVWTLGPSTVHGYALLRDGVQFAGGQGVLLLYHNSSVYTKNDLGQWFVATDTTWQSVAGDPRPMTVVAGIDVSHWQGVIDWNAVKASGQIFAFIKATESYNFTDSRFVANWRNAKAAGLKRGMYHFYRFSASSASQLNNLMKAFASVGYDYGELPIAVDIEDTDTKPNANALLGFIKAVQVRTGRRVCVYTGNWWWNTARWGGPVTWAKDYDLWCASYTATPLVPSDWLSVGWRFWQYSSTGSVGGISGNVDLNKFNGTSVAFAQYLTTVNVTAPPPPTGTAWRGLHMRADGNSVDLDFQCITVAKLTGAKLMTNTAFSELDRLLTFVPASNIVLRLFSAGDDPILGNAQKFFDVQDAWLNYFNSKGCKWVEVHNEQNIAQEGLGVFWQNANGFAAWYVKVYDLVKTKYPNLQVTMGGLSPQPNVPEWVSMMQANIGRLDWIAAHSYWVDAISMNSTESGRYYRRFLTLGNPVIITEFANIATTDSDIAKGQQYKSYYASLESGVLGACVFVSSASDRWFNESRQTWARGNSLTDIPKVVGA